jgi:hypothetical protein
MQSEFGLDPAMVDVLGVKKEQLVSLIGEQQLAPARKIDQSQAIKDLARRYVQSNRFAS